MITADDIKILVASGEGYNVEFKVSVPSKVREITEEVCAFANAAGGVVLIGIDDQNKNERFKQRSRTAPTGIQY